MKKLKQIEEVEAQSYAFSKKHKHKTYASVIIVLFMLLIIVSGSLVEISVSNNLATEGLTLAKIQQHIDVIKKDNMLLSEQVYANASYTHIASQAATLGFVEAK